MFEVSREVRKEKQFSILASLSVWTVIYVYVSLLEDSNCLARVPEHTFQTSFNVICFRYVGIRGDSLSSNKSYLEREQLNCCKEWEASLRYHQCLISTSELLISLQSAAINNHHLTLTKSRKHIYQTFFGSNEALYGDLEKVLSNYKTYHKIFIVNRLYVFCWVRWGESIFNFL